MPDLPDTMNAAAIDDFGGPDQLSLHRLPVPDAGLDEILVRVHTAGVGVWDPAEQRGELASLTDREPSFPYVPGSDAAGTVVDRGDDVEDFQVEDRVYASTFLNPKGGGYAEYVAVSTDRAAVVPDSLDAVLDRLREGGRVAWPHGVRPEPRVPGAARGGGYDGEPDRETLEEVNHLAEAGPFRVEVARTFSLADAAEAHRCLEEHYLGKLALSVRS